MWRELLAAPKVAVPLAILLWLLVSLSLWLLAVPRVEAQPSNLPLGSISNNWNETPQSPVDDDPNDPDSEYCPDDVNQNGWGVDEAFVGTWGMDPRMIWEGMSETEQQPLNPGMSWDGRRLKLLSNPDYANNPDTDSRKWYTCYRFRGHIIYAERWGNDYDWESNGDEDGNSYVELDDAQEDIVNNRERRNLRRWAQARDAADLHAEHVPRDQVLATQDFSGGTLNFPCLDWGLEKDTLKHCTKNLESWDGESYSTMAPYDPDGPDNVEGTSDDDPGVPVELIGAFVYDANWGFKEVHPIRQQKYDATVERANPVQLSETCKSSPCETTDGGGTSPGDDTTAPQVTSVKPTDGETEVNRRASVTATFSEDIDSSTLTTSTFTLVKDGTTTPISARVSYDSASRTATLKPSSRLDANTTYTATLSTAIKDKAGNTLDCSNNKCSWSFTTRSR